MCITMSFIIIPAIAGVNRRVLWMILVPLTVLIAVIIAGMLADAWLESAGGKSAIESRLSRSLNLQVSLGQEFDLRLFPSLAIAGSGLRVSSPGAVELAGFERYALSLNLPKLVKGDIEVTAVNLVNGFVVLEALPASNNAGKEKSSRAARALPDIGTLELENFSIFSDNPHGDPLATIGHLSISDFRPGKETHLSTLLRLPAGLALELEAIVVLEQAAGGLDLQVDVIRIQPGRSIEVGAVDFGAVTGGRFRWREGSRFSLVGVNWSHESRGSLQFDARYDAAERTGLIEFELTLVRPVGDAARPDETLRGRMSLNYGDSILFAPEIEVEILGQQINGHACMPLVPPTSLHVQLHAGKLDLDRLQAWVPRGGADAGPPDVPWLNLELFVEELRYKSVLAEVVHLQIGGPVECSRAAG